MDFGEARIGLATSDASGTLATPRRTVLRRSDEQALEEIGRFVREEEVEGIVLGLPRQKDGVESELAPRVRSFARKLREKLGLPVHLVDEHLTNREAAGRFGSGVETDAGAAAVILEEFLLAPRR